MSSLSSDLKRFNFRCSNIHFSALSSLAHSSNLSLNQFLLEKGLSDGLSFDPNLRHFIQRIAFESFIIREQLPTFAKSIHSLSKLLSTGSLSPSDPNVASDELKPLFKDVLKPYNPTLDHLTNQPTSISSGNPSSSSIKLQQLLQQLPLLFDKLAFSTEFLITLFGNIKLYPDILRNLHSICLRNPHILSTSLNFDFSPSTTSNTSKASNLSHSSYGSYSHLPNFAFLTLVPHTWAFSSASLLKSNGLALGSGLSLVKSHAYAFSLGRPYSLLS